MKLALLILLAAISSEAQEIILIRGTNGLALAAQHPNLDAVDLDGDPRLADVRDLYRSRFGKRLLVGSPPALLDLESGDLVERIVSIEGARQERARREREEVPQRVKDARAKLDAIGLQIGLTNERPERIVSRVMRTNTNAANAVLRAEAAHAIWTIRDFQLARRAGLQDPGE